MKVGHTYRTFRNEKPCHDLQFSNDKYSIINQTQEIETYNLISIAIYNTNLLIS